MNEILLQLKLIDKQALDQIEKLKKELGKLEDTNLKSTKKVGQERKKANKVDESHIIFKEKKAQQQARLRLKEQKDRQAQDKRFAKERESQESRAAKLVQRREASNAQQRRRAAQQVQKATQNLTNLTHRQMLSNQRNRAREEARDRRNAARDINRANRTRHREELARIRERERAAVRAERRVAREQRNNDSRRRRNADAIRSFFSLGGRAGGIGNLVATTAQVAASMFAAQRSMFAINTALKELNQENAFFREFSVGALAETRRETFGLIADTTLQRQLIASKAFGISQKESVDILKTASALSRLDPQEDASKLAESFQDAIFRGSALRIDNAQGALAKFVPMLAEVTKTVSDPVERSRKFAQILAAENGEIRKDFQRSGVFDETLTTRIQKMINELKQLGTGIGRLFFGIAGLTVAIGFLTSKVLLSGIAGAGSSLLGGIGAIGSGLAGPVSAAMSLIPGPTQIVGMVLGSAGVILKVVKGVLGSIIGIITSIVTTIAPFVIGALALTAVRALSLASPEGSDPSIGVVGKVKGFGLLAQNVLSAVLGGKDFIKVTKEQIKTFEQVFGKNWGAVRDRIFEIGYGLKAAAKAFLQPIDALAKNLFGEDVFGKLGDDIKRFVPLGKEIGGILGQMTKSTAEFGLKAFRAMKNLFQYIGGNGNAFKSAASIIVGILNKIIIAAKIIDGGGRTSLLTDPVKGFKAEQKRSEVRQEFEDRKRNIQAAIGPLMPNDLEKSTVIADFKRKMAEINNEDHSREVDVTTPTGAALAVVLGRREEKNFARDVDTSELSENAFREVEDPGSISTGKTAPLLPGLKPVVKWDKEDIDRLVGSMEKIYRSIMSSKESGVEFVPYPARVE